MNTSNQIPNQLQKYIKISVLTIKGLVLSTLISPMGAISKTDRLLLLNVNSLKNIGSRTIHTNELLSTKKSRRAESHTLESEAKLFRFINQTLQNELPESFKAQSENITERVFMESYRYGWDPLFLVSVMKTESQFNPLAVGTVGELGLMQVRPNTALWLEKKLGLRAGISSELRNPLSNITVGAAYLNYLRQKARRNNMYIVAYNAGLAKTRANTAAGSMPRQYLDRIVANLSALQVTFATTQELSKQQNIAALGL